MNEVLLYGGIDSESSANFINEINEVDDNLLVRVNTGGGEPMYAWGMAAKFSEFEKTKKVQVDGKAFSAGFYFCLYADEVNALDVSQFMIHRAAFPSWYEESSYFAESEKTQLENVNAKLKEAFVNKVDVAKFEKIAKVTVDEVFSFDTRIDVFLTAKEAKQIGLVDNILTITPKMKAEISTNMEMFGMKPIEKVTINTNNKNHKKMTLEAFKSEHPEVFAEALNLGASNEKVRVNAWMVFNDIDPVTVTSGIKEGKELTVDIMADLTRKKVSAEHLASLETTSAPVVVITDPKPTTETSELEKLSAKLDAELGLTK
jgi:ATP-dependent protease ClpP protease subunit